MTLLFIAPERDQDYSLFIVEGVGVFFSFYSSILYHCAIILLGKGKRKNAEMVEE